MKWLTSHLEKLRSGDNHRTLKTITSAQNSVVRRNDRSLILLSSNNYLGLTTHPAVVGAAIDAAYTYGTGSGGSRLTTGNTDLHEKLEQSIASFKGTENAIVFGSGYMANVGIISSIMGKGDLILSDEYNHASIIDGCRFSRADCQVYAHRDMEHLESILRSNQRKAGVSDQQKKLIITDGVFSMDGTIAPLPEIVELAQDHDCMVMVDDAHAAGILGKYHRGTADYFGLHDGVDIQMGTLSKAFASSGGYAAGSDELVEYLQNMARSFIFSTSLPPSAIASAETAINVVRRDGPAKQLWKNVDLLKNGLSGLGYDINTSTQIIPIIVGNSEITMAAAKRLEDLGIIAHGIRPPSVPQGTSRLRITAMATHKKSDLEEALESFEILSHEFPELIIER